MNTTTITLVMLRSCSVQYADIIFCIQVKSCLFPFIQSSVESIQRKYLFYAVCMLCSIGNITEVTGGNFKETNKMTSRVSLIIKTTRQAKHVTAEKKLKEKNILI